MPVWFSHVAQAEHNERTFQFLNTVSPDHLDWQLTCLFYAALHYADAYLHHIASANILHRRSHAERIRLIRQHMGAPYITYYQELQQRSEDARYSAVFSTAVYVQALYDNEFTRIRAHVRTALSL